MQMMKIQEDRQLDTYFYLGKKKTVQYFWKSQIQKNVTLSSAET